MFYIKKVLLLVILFMGFNAVGQIDTALHNYVGLQHRYQHFTEKYSDRQLSILEYARIQERVTYVGRANNLLINGVNKQLYELEVYPKYNGGYAFLNVGYGPNMPFRIGAESFFNDGPIETSLGMRYIVLEDGGIPIYTGTLAAYVGNGWISFRPTFINLEDGISSFYSLTARNYFKDKYNYIGAILMRGFDVDQSRNYLNNESPFLLDIYIARFEAMKSIKSSFVIVGAVEGRYEYVPYNIQGFVDSYAIELGFRKFF